MTDFSLALRGAQANAAAVHPKSNTFRIVRNERGDVLGWTFCTAPYPHCHFGWVTLRGIVTHEQHELRHAAKKALKSLEV